MTFLHWDVGEYLSIMLLPNYFVRHKPSAGSINCLVVVLIAQKVRLHVKASFSFCWKS